MVTVRPVNGSGATISPGLLVGKKRMNEQAVPIGESIRARRVALRLSQRDLACAAGTTAAAICHVERGIRKLSANLLVRVAGALQCSADEILSGTAGALSSQSLLRKITAAASGLPPADQDDLFRYCDYLRYRAQRRSRVSRTGGNN